MERKGQGGEMGARYHKHKVSLERGVSRHLSLCSTAAWDDDFEIATKVKKAGEISRARFRVEGVWVNGRGGYRWEGLIYAAMSHTEACLSNARMPCKPTSAPIEYPVD